MLRAVDQFYRKPLWFISLFLSLSLCLPPAASAQGWDWVKEWNPVSGLNANDYTYQMEASSDGVYLSGSHKNNSAPTSFILKFDSDGQIVWAKELTGATISAIHPASNGGVYFCGGFKDNASIQSSVLQSQGGTDGYFALFSSAGSVDWIKTFGGSENDAATALTESGSNLFLTGYANEREDYLYGKVSDLILARSDLSGGNILSKSFTRVNQNNVGGAKGQRITFNAGLILVIADGTNMKMDGFITGYNGPYTNQFLSAFDPELNVKWVKPVCNGPQQFRDFVRTPKGTVMCGSGRWTKGGWAFAHAYDRNGQQLWNKTYKVGDHGSSMEIPDIVSENGYHYSILNSDSLNLNPAGLSERMMRVGIIDEQGEFNMMFNARSRDLVNGIAIAKHGGSFFILGSLNSNARFGQINFEKGNSELFLGKYTLPVAVEKAAGEKEITLVPNTANGTFTLHLDEKYKDLQLYIQINDMRGKLVYEANVKGSTEIPIISKLTPGRYLLTLKSDIGTDVKQIQVNPNR